MSGLQQRHKRGRRGSSALQRVFVVLLFSLAIVLAMPHVLRLGVIEGLIRLGADAVVLESLAINPFLGTLSLNGLVVTRAGKTVLHIRRAEIKVAWLPLLQRRIDIEWFRLSGADVDVQVNQKHRLAVAGFLVPQATQGAAAPGWGFGWHGLVIRDAKIRYRRPGLDSEFLIAQGYLDQAASWRVAEPTHWQLAGQMDGAPFRMYGRWQPLQDDMALLANLKLTGLEMAHYVGFVPGVKRLSGKLDMEGAFRLALPGQGPRIGYRGRVGLRDWQLRYDRYDLGGQGASVKVALDVKGGDQGQSTASGSGSLALVGFEMTDDLHAGHKVTVKKLVLSGVNGKLNEGGSFASGRITGLVMGGPPMGDPQFASGGDAIIKVPDLAVLKGRWSVNDGLAFGQVTLDRPWLVLARDAQGAINLVQLMSLSDAAGHPVSAPADTQGRSPAMAVKIGTVRVSGATLDIVDQGVSPAYQSRVLIHALHINHVDSAAGDQPLDWSLKAQIGAFSRIDLHGQATPFAATHDFSALGTLRGLSLPPLSGYSAASIGYFVDQGQADVDFDIRSRKRLLSGGIELRLARLSVSPAEAGKVAQLSAQLSMPLPAALAVLKNDQDEISLSLPLTGNLDAPEFSLAPLFNQVLGIAMERAAVGYLSNLLQPYATVFTVARYAYQLASSIRLDPLPFSPGLTIVPEQSLPYIEKLALLLRERPGISLRLCGKATSQDVLRLAESAPSFDASAEDGVVSAAANQLATAVVTQEARIDDRLLVLAADRAKRIKTELVDVYAIDPARLFLCRPEIEKDDAALPRVDISI